MDTTEIFHLLRKRFSEDVIIEISETADRFIKVRAEHIQAVCLYLRYNPETQYANLANLSAVDYPDDNRIDLVYHLYSFLHRHFCVLKTSLNREEPAIESIEAVWKVANWFEREVYDLFGVRFKGHSNLRRILLPEDWKGYPLRKDYTEESEYHEIPTYREEPLKVLKGESG